MNTSCNGINDQMNGGEDLFQTKFPIHHACRVGNGSFLTEVVQSGQASLQHFTQEDTLYYRSPIHWAALNAQGEIIKGLVKLGVDINTQTSISKLSALHFAVKTGNEILVKMMIFDLKANPNLQDKNNETVLHKSAQLGDFQMINIFLNHGADVFIKNNLGLTAFKVAEQLGHRKCANLLSQKQISCQLGHRGESLLNGTSGAMNCIENGLNHGKNGLAMKMHQSNGKKRACQPNCVQDENGFVAKRMRQSEEETATAGNPKTPLSPAKALQNIPAEVNKSKKVNLGFEIGSIEKANKKYVEYLRNAGFPVDIDYFDLQK